MHPALGYFDRYARRWDSLYDDESRARYLVNRLLRRGVYRRVELALERMRALGSPSVLDVGCGSGRNAVLFAREGARLVVGCDFAPEMVRLAEAHAAAAGLAERARFLVRDVREWPVDDEQRFDLVVALGVLDYYAEPRPLLEALRARATGEVCFSVRRPTLVRMPVRKLRYALRGLPIYFFSERAVRRACAEAGFASCQVREGGSGSWFVVARS